MRLNIETFQLEEFFNSEVPLYCIMSHRWEGAEISYQEFTTLPHKELEQKKGKPWRKLEGFVDVCRVRGPIRVG